MCLLRRPPTAATISLRTRMSPVDVTRSAARLISSSDMFEMLILDGDLVIVRQDAQARNGDIVIALLEDEATCKTLNVTPDGVWLMPENPAYPPIDGTGCQILGIVKALYREY